MKAEDTADDDANPFELETKLLGNGAIYARVFERIFVKVLTL